jgi:hypothetical protein
MKIGKNSDLLIVFVALVALAGLLYTTSKRKGTDMMSALSPQQGGYNVPSPAQPLGQNEKYAGAKGVKTNTYGMQSAKLDDPTMLLPNDSNSQWASLNPQGGGMLKNVNLLQAGSLVGINTVGSTMRNANLQLRSEPPNPQGSVGPWMNSTIEPDVVRQPLEIGGQF